MHPDPEIEAAVRHAEDLGWRFERVGRGHAWGRLYCPGATRAECIVSVWSTPRNAHHHARQIARAVEKCCCEKGG